MVAGTKLWQDAAAMPDVLADLVAGPAGASETADLLRTARRVVATGNGAAAYAAHAVWTASLEHPAERTDVVCVPAGLLATGGFRWREGDVPLVFSSSGELRDVVGLLADDGSEVPRLRRPYALVSASATSTLARSAGAVTVVPVRSQDAVTHTQAFVGNVLAGLLLWELVVGRNLGLAAATLPERCAAALRGAPDWADAAEVPESLTAAITFGASGAWAGALETALLLKEVAGVPTEGMETREGATSGMYALRAGHLAVSLPTRHDRHVEEAERICARTGAAVLRLPGGDDATGLLAAITTFPAALALALRLGTRAGLDVDTPAWTDAYYSTARTP